MCNAEKMKDCMHVVNVYPDVTFQKIRGFGGAFTESAAHNYAGMGDARKQEMIQAYFGRDGLRYNLGRLHIGSCDFALGNYAYVEEGDEELKTFSIAHDEEEILPLIRDAQEAYGEKENGAVFSHMAVMYANALYRRGFAKEGYKALQALADAALHFETSRIYPGIPEYFNNEGRGMYHYLTGAASWYMLTFITEVFGVRGKAGDLEISPALMRKQFDESGTAGLELPFAGKRFRVTVKNPDRLECGDYRIESAWVDGQPLALSCEECRVQTGDTGMAGNACSRKRADTVTVLLARADIMQLADKVHEIEILLGKGEDGQQ